MLPSVSCEVIKSSTRYAIVTSICYSTRIRQDINPRTTDETMARIQNAVTKLHTRLPIACQIEQFQNVFQLAIV